MSGITTAWSERLTEYVAEVEANYLTRHDDKRWLLSQEFTKEFLIKDYPVLLSNVRCGISIQPGWASLVHHLCSDITMVMAANPTLKVSVDQVKQKFGRLRFSAMVYTTATDLDGIFLTNIYTAPEHVKPKERIRDLIIVAEKQSESVCEVCGAPGKIVNVSGWLAAACERHGQP